MAISLKQLIYSSALALSILSTSYSVRAQTTFSLDYDRSRGGGPYGASVAVDPNFNFYNQQAWSKTFNDIKRAGFTAVHIIDTGTNITKGNRGLAIVNACRSAGLAPILRIYPGTDGGIYQSYPAWRQKTLDGLDGAHDWRTYLCPNNDAFLTYYKNDIKNKFQTLGYDGIQMAEIWFEVWGGPDDKGTPRPKYACICNSCRTKFKAKSGVDPVDLLTDPAKATYWKKPENAAIYQQWVDFRVDSIVNFGLALSDSVRAAKSDATIDVMILSAARQEPTKLREYQAVDVQRLITEIKPNIVSVQDAWQDWLQPNLQPSFIQDYGREYLPVIRQYAPNAYTLTHADIGSQPVSKRSLQWISDFSTESVNAGFSAPSFYEWSISNLATHNWTADVKDSEKYGSKASDETTTTAKKTILIKTAKKKSND